jgi:hypothetical protein
MRVLRLAAVVCLAAFVIVFMPSSRSVRGRSQSLAARAVPGPLDVLVAAPGNANYAYGRSRPQRVTAAANALPTASFVVTYTGFEAFPSAQAAFQAAVDVWAHTIVSSAPIRVDAEFAPLGTGVLGVAGPTRVCQPSVGASNTYYAAALADALDGSTSCAAGRSSEIFAQFNSEFGSWDFGTSGIGVENEYNFMTVVLHELAHGLGFYGSMTASNGVGSFSSTPDIYDRYAVTGNGFPLLSFVNPSSALGAQLISDNTFFNGPRAIANHGTPPKLETHDFTTFGESLQFLAGSSYSHVDEGYSGTPDGLMTWALAGNEVYTDPGPIVRGMLQDEGWTLTGAPCAFGLSPVASTLTAAGGSGTVLLNTGSNCAWTAASNSPFITITSAGSGTGSTVVTYTVSVNSGVSPRTGTLSIGGQTLTITQNGTGPAMSLDRSTLAFGAATTGATLTSSTSAQTVRLTKSGAGAVTWTAMSNQPWLTVTPASGSGSATLTIGVQFAPGLMGPQTGAITLTFTGAGNAPDPIAVTLDMKPSGATGAPFGSFDTPVDNSIGITGSIALTGWALDDVEVGQVRVVRDPVAGEATGAQIPIGTAVLVDGARPDVATLYGSYPFSGRAGWGYLLLTNMLPNQGNGTFRFYAYADDTDGHSRLLGMKTIACANSMASAPFGAIDTPAQGDTVSGLFNNFGWVLAPGGARADPPGGGTVTIVIDGMPAGVPAGWTNRSDLTTLFPGYSELTSALAVQTFDSAALTNGVHTIAWGVTATNSDSAGIGSRYFTVSNDATSLVAGLRSTRQRSNRSLVVERPGLNATAAMQARVVSARHAHAAITGRVGWAQTAPFRMYAPDANGGVLVDGEELGLFDLRLNAADTSRRFGDSRRGGTYAGYLRNGETLSSLPVGSHLDPETGAFTWQPGVGFTGAYDFVFTECPASPAAVDNTADCVRHDTRIVLHPKGSNRVGPQVTIDMPAADARVPGRFVVAGWAIDVDDWTGTGIDTLHVWAYPRATCGSADCNLPPIFLGAATYGGQRPDVAALYGQRFLESGYGLVVDGLAAGTYDIAVFAWSTPRGGFVPAKTVRVKVE